MKKALGLYLLLCCYAGLAHAETINDAKIWTGIRVFGQVQPDSRWLYNLKLESRWQNVFQKLDQGVVRPSVGYQLSDTLSGWLGFDWVPTDFGDISVQEYRTWQELFWLREALHIEWAFRTRLEQRYQAQQPDTAWRLRQRLQVVFLEMTLGDLMPTLSYEIFLNLNHPQWVQTKTINQHRSFAGFFWPINDSITLEFGYLNRFFPLPGFNISNHIFFSALIIEF
jgi:Protein of unknown function (DUF2490)